jgi:hypothetical protein
VSETRHTELAREARNQLAKALADINRPDREYGFGGGINVVGHRRFDCGWVKITARAGATAPYTYTADVYAPKSGFATFSAETSFEATGESIVSKLGNVRELGPSSSGAAPLAVGDFVYVRWFVDDWYVCDEQNYAGVYVA